MNLRRGHLCTLLHVPPYGTLLFFLYVYIVAVQQTNFESKRRSLRLFSTVVTWPKGDLLGFKNRHFWGNFQISQHDDKPHGVS